MSHNMHGTIERLLARAESLESKSHKSKTATTSSKSKAVAKSKASKVTDYEHTCAFGTDNDGNPLTGLYATCLACATESVTIGDDWEAASWTPPVSLRVFAQSEHGYKGEVLEQVSTINLALDHGHNDLVIAYHKYVSTVFDRPVTPSSFERMVNKVEYRRASGLGNLGLLAMGSDDIVADAVWWATVDKFIAYLRGIGMDNDTADLWSRALRDHRTKDELLELSNSEPGNHYYEFRYSVVKSDDGTPHRTGDVDGIRKYGKNHADIRKAREYLEVFNAITTELSPSGMPWSSVLEACEPRIGAAYRYLRHVERAGYRRWGQLVQEMHYDAYDNGVNFVSGLSHGQDIDESAFNKYEVPEHNLDREVWLDVLNKHLDAHLEDLDSVIVINLFIDGHGIDAVCKHLIEDQGWSQSRTHRAVKNMTTVKQSLAA